MRLLATEGGGFHVPPLEELFEFPAFLFKDNTWLALNKTGVLYLLSAVIVSALMIGAFKNAKVVPGKLQGAMEAVVDFIREGVVL
ncbi:MAG: F-type H+-transporting ATPase subunit a, partial [Glaciecola sp.]